VFQDGATAVLQHVDARGCHVVRVTWSLDARLPLNPVSPKPAILVCNMASPPEINMASSDIITEVEIQPDIQEVEIETIPVEIPCETVETTIEGEDGQPMIALQPLPEPGREEIILQTQEEIVGADPLSVYDQIPVPENDIYVESSPGPSRKAAKKARKSGGTRFRASDHAIFGEMATETKARKWEQKQVQIKTLEGEFSVTMWASGTDDGEFMTGAYSAFLRFVSPHQATYLSSHTFFAIISTSSCGYALPVWYSDRCCVAAYVRSSMNTENLQSRVVVRVLDRLDRPHCLFWSWERHYACHGGSHILKMASLTRWIARLLVYRAMAVYDESAANAVG